MRIIDLGVCLESQEQPEIKNDIGDGRTILIPPDDGSGCPGRIHTLYINDGGDCPCVAPEQATGEGPDLTWDGTDKEVPNLETPEYDTKTETTHDPYPSLAFAPPPTCRWVGTTIDAITLSRDTVLVMYRGDGADPCHTPGQYKTQITHNQITPGAKLVLTHYLNCNPPQNIITASHYDWWRNCCIAGGEIVALQGEKNKLNLKYTIEIFGRQVTVPPIDWSDEPLEIGDWVLVLAVGGNCAKVDNKADLAPDGDFFYMVPYLKVGDFAANNNTELLEFAVGDNRPLFGLRVLPATIIEIDSDADTADVETDLWGRIDGVPVHYHCPNREDTTGGSAAFREDDNVIIAIADAAHEAHEPGPAMPPSLRWIIGHADGQRRACIPNYYVFLLRAYLVEPPFPTEPWERHIMVWDAGEAECQKIRSDSTEVWGAVMVWDLNANAMATDIPDGNGGFLEFPCYGHKANGNEVLEYFYTLTDSINVSTAMWGIGDAFGNETRFAGDGVGHFEYDIDACGISEKTTYDGIDDYGGSCKYYSYDYTQYANDWRKISNPADKRASWEFGGNPAIAGTMCVNMRYESETWNQWELRGADGDCGGPKPGHHIEHSERTRLQCVYGDIFDYSFSRRWKKCVKDGSGNLVHYWDLAGSPLFVQLKKKTSDSLFADKLSQNILWMTLHSVSENDILQIWVSKAGNYDGLSNVVRQPNPLNFDPQYCTQPHPVPRGKFRYDDHTIPPHGTGYFRAKNIDGDYKEESLVQYEGIGISYEFCDRPRSYDEVQVFCATKSYTDPDDFDINGQTKNTALADAIGFLFEYYKTIAEEEGLGIEFRPIMYMGHRRPKI